MSCTVFSSLSESLDSRSRVGHAHLWHLFGRDPQECSETIRNWQFWLRQERKKPYTDVTREIVFEHERQVSCNGGLAGTEWLTLVTRANVNCSKERNPTGTQQTPTETWHRSSMKCSDLDFPLIELNGDFCTDLYEMDQHWKLFLFCLCRYGKLKGKRTRHWMRNLNVRMWHMWQANCVSSRVIFTFWSDLPTCDIRFARTRRAGQSLRSKLHVPWAPWRQNESLKVQADWRGSDMSILLVGKQVGKWQIRTIYPCKPTPKRFVLFCCQDWWVL